MAFLDKLGAQLSSSFNQQFDLAENTNRVFDYGSLGKLSGRIDRSEERKYLENGVIGHNLKPRSFAVWMQQPDITVIIKKRQFASLSENFRFDLLNQDEKLQMRAIKRLFYNKCRLIAAYERLSKIEQVGQQTGLMSESFLPLIFNSVEIVNSIRPGLIGGETQNTLNVLKRLKNYSEPSQVTTWMNDAEIPYLLDSGEGNGVFELTLVSSFNCTNSVNLGGGNGSLSIEDPYKMMIITEEDIEQALAQVSNFFPNSVFFRLSQEQLEQANLDLQKALSEKRIQRSVGQIRFFTNQNSLLYQKVRAIYEESGEEILFNYSGGTLGIGASVEIDPSSLFGDQALSLTNGEIQLFKQIIENFYLLFGLQQNANSAQLEYNERTNRIRRNLYLEFLGKAMISSGDSVRVFISSKSIQDTRISRGIRSDFTEDSLLSNINQVMGQLESSFENLQATFDGSEQSFAEIEKNVITGPEFPGWLWKMMRNQFTRQAAGTCVFAGLVREASSNYDGGRYTLSVSLEDHSAFFKKGQININPALDVYNGDLYDPLTPFEIDFDAASGFRNGDFPKLLDENLRLLNSGIVRASSGRFRGQALTEDTYLLADAEKVAGNIFRQRLNDPLGFVYRWKKGIGSLTLFGEPGTKNFFQNDTAPALTADPFAGQDVMNVISLLVTGSPYNFNTFLRGALNAGNLQRSELFNSDGAPSFFRGLISNLIRNNQTWGNFVPFKKMIVNDSAYQFLRSGEFDLSVQNSRLNELLRQRAEKFDQLASVVPNVAANPTFYRTGLGGQLITDANLANSVELGSLSRLGEDIIRLDLQIQELQNDFNRHLQDPNLQQSQGTLLVFGDDLSFDPSVTFGNDEEARKKSRRELRNKINYLTQRRLWKVKSNEDPNFFIVDDSYDKNYDLQAFEKSLNTNFSTFKSTYTNVFEKLQSVAQVLGLEVFADSQGHIQARPPQYNRMPSSVFQRMLRNKEVKGLRIFPEYLEKLFLNQVRGLTDSLEIVEDRIRLLTAFMGANSDAAASSLLNGSTFSGDFGSRSFVFTTNENDGKFGSKDIRVLLTQNDPALLESVADTAIESLQTQIRGATTATVNFDILQRSNIINSPNSFVGITGELTDRITEIGQRIANKTGSPAPTLQSILGSKAVPGYNRTQTEIVQLSQQLASLISERQQLVKLLSNSLTNLQEGRKLNGDSSNFSRAIFGNLNSQQSKEYPEILEHMIEDEAIDDFGKGSGKRYVLSDDRILNVTVTEAPPDWVAVEVTGAIENALVETPTSLGGISERGGNAIATAFAVDYDHWRMYGFTGAQSVYLPFLSDPESQCAPYAVYLLNMARKNILQASVSCIGNEYLQAGEVYYLEDRNLLFYSDSVSHSFSYGGNYTTTLNLKYGHPPGEYIPTMLDIIGKGLYTTRHSSNLIRHNRFNNQNNPNEQHLSVLMRDVQAVGVFGSAGIESLVSGNFGDENRKNLGHLLLASSGLSRSVTSQTLFEIRLYYSSKLGYSLNSDLELMANSVVNWLVNPQKPALFNASGGQTLLPDKNTSVTLTRDQIRVVPIDLSENENALKNPSSAAWNAARTLALTSSYQSPFAGTVAEPSSATLGQAEREILLSAVLDIWVITEEIAETQSKPTGTIKNQAQEEELQRYLNNFNKSLGIS